MSLRNRLLIIAALVLASGWSLWPRTVTVRERVPGSSAFREREIQRVPLKYGLDLQGGIHLALEVDETKGAVADKSEAIDRALKVVRTRIDQFGVAEPVVQKVGDERIVVELPGVDDPERARKLVEETAFLQFQITDETNALARALPRIDAVIREQTSGRGGAAAGGAGPGGDAARDGSPLGQLLTPIDSASRRDTTRADSARGSDSLPLGASTGPFSRLLQAGQSPGEFQVAKDDARTVERYLALPQVRAALPPGKDVLWGARESAPNEPEAPYRTLYVVDTRAIIDGSSIVDARPVTDPLEGNVVTFSLNNEGGRRFRSETGKHIGDYMAIVLDDVVMGRPPVIQSAIGTRGQITMRGQPLQQAQDLALVLRAGSLPVPLKTVESRRIGASLGADSIRDGLAAGALGVALVVLIMVGYYRLSGALAVAALVLYVLFTLATLAGFNAVLTLPGLAGLVLSVGIAVDANVLIFERIREELTQGKSVRVAIDEGFRRAMTAIIDSNVSTILTAAVLYYLGTGPVQGFAVTLIAGIVASMVSAIFVVRTFYLLWLQRSRGAQTLSI